MGAAPPLLANSTTTTTTTPHLVSNFSHFLVRHPMLSIAKRKTTSTHLSRPVDLLSCARIISHLRLLTPRSSNLLKFPPSASLVCATGLLSSMCIVRLTPLTTLSHSLFFWKNSQCSLPSSLQHQTMLCSPEILISISTLHLHLKLHSSHPFYQISI